MLVRPAIGGLKIFNPGDSIEALFFQDLRAVHGISRIYIVQNDVGIQR